MKKSPQGPRIYGTFLDADGVRHELSGVTDGTFSKRAGGWDSITTCGKYSTDKPDTNPDHYTTCIKCVCTQRVLAMRSEDVEAVRGRHANLVMIDEAQDFSPTELADLVDKVGETIKAGATRGNGGTR